MGADSNGDATGESKDESGENGAKTGSSKPGDGEGELTRNVLCITYSVFLLENNQSSLFQIPFLIEQNRNLAFVQFVEHIFVAQPFFFISHKRFSFRRIVIIFENSQDYFDSKSM